MTKEEYDLLQSLTIDSFCSLAHVVRQREVSDETRKKISEKKKGCIVSEETRKKLSLALKGKKLNEEIKQKMRIGRAEYEEWIKQNPNSEEAKKRADMYRKRSNTCENRRKVRTPIGDFPSLRAAKEAYGFSSGNVIRLKIKRGEVGFSYLD